jgi:peptidoglycan/LPS O-acetylase OafA/YrhL
VRAAFSLRRNLARIFVPPPGHLRPLDGLRALSVLWVVLFHAGWYARFSLPLESWAKLAFSPWMLPIWRGDFGVDLFFVLSGFLIAGMLLDEHDRDGHVALGLFYVRRLLRLWPALLLVAGLELFTDDPHRYMVWANVLYVNDFVPVGLVALGWTWSLAIEEQFYLVCPWLLRAVYPLRTRDRLAVMAALLATLVGIAAWVVVKNDIRPWDAEVVGQLDMGRWGFAFDVFYDKPWMRAGALLAGVTAAILFREPVFMDALARGGWLTGGLVVAAGAAMAMATHWQMVLGESRTVEIVYLATFRTVFGVGAAFLLLVTLSSHSIGEGLARALSWRALFPFSQLAYAAYLVNPMVTMFVGRMLQREVAHGEEPLHLLVPWDLIGTFGCAAVIHVLVERPGMELRPRRAVWGSR